MRLQRRSTGERFVLNPNAVLGVGGEARIYPVPPGRELVAKIYHRPEGVQAQKLEAMLANPPDDPMAEQGHISIAWPLDLLHTGEGVPLFVGYLMPRVSGTRPIFTYYNPATRRRLSPLFNWMYLHRAARNLAASVRALHGRGYVIGDVNESNILVGDTALVTLVDTDSFQVHDSNQGAIYRCPVGKPEYTPPEMQSRAFSACDRLSEHDRFGLAVLIFQLLMEGTHPFSGVYQGAGDPPPLEARIQAGHFPYGTRPGLYAPMPLAPPLDILSPTLRQLFVRCFEDGHRLPQARPDALTWQTALQESERGLISCAANLQHRYGDHLSACPWCVRAAKLGGRDPFPARPPALESRSVSKPTLAPLRAPVTPPAWVAATAPVAYSIPASGPLAGAPSVRPVLTLTLPRNGWAWGAFWCAVVALLAPTALMPVVNLLAGLTSAGCAVGTWRTAHRYAGRGKWLAGTSATVGGIMALIVFSILVLAAHSATDVQVLPMQSGVRAVAFSPNGKTLAAASNRAEDQRLIGGQVFLWDVAAARQEQILADYPGNIVALSYLPDGKSLAVASDGPLAAGEVDLMDAQLRGGKRVLATTPGAQALVASPDGTLVACGSRDGRVRLWNVQTGTLWREWEHQGEVYAVAFSPDSHSLAIGSGSPSGSITPGAVMLFDLQTGQPRWRRSAHSNGVLALAFSPDGSTLASGGNDDMILLHDVHTGVPRREIAVNSLGTPCLAYSPDGRTLASGGFRLVDGDIRYEISLWDALTGSLRRALIGHRERIDALAFAPDGRRLASAGMDNSVRLWRLY